MLTPSAVQNAKPQPCAYKLTDGRGLYLIVRPDGGRWWRFDYRRPGTSKRNTLSLGTFPDVSLRRVREKREEFRALVADGIDPAQRRVSSKAQDAERAANTFGAAADAWHAFRTLAWAAKTSKQARDYLDKDLLPKLKNRPLDEIESSELGALMEAIEKRGAFDVAKKSRQWLKAIFSYARAKGLTKNDPAKDLAAIAMPGPGKQHFAHLPLAELPTFLAALEADRGSPLVKACAMLALWTANRPGVTRTLRWSEIDLDAGLWTIEKDRPGMKRGYYHLTPLPTQAVTLLRDVHNLTGHFEHVFIGRNEPTQPLSDGAVAGLFKRIGYRNKQTMHGFRHLVSTALNDLGYESDWVERQLAHGDPDKIRGTYNKAQYLEPRRKMMQAWADHIDALRTGTNVLPMKRKRA